MASIPFDVLFDPLEFPVLPHDVDPDDAVEIGATNNAVSVTVSLTEFRDGELVFSDEIPVTMCIEPCDLRDGTTANNAKNKKVDPYHQWIRLAYKVASNSSTISSGYSLVATCWPRGNAWTYQTKFKPVWKGLKDQKPKPGGDVDTFPKLLHWLEAASFDYWETYSGVLTAGLSRPKRFRSQDTRNAREKSLTLLGACANFDQCEAFLRESEKVRMLRSRTKEGTIAFGHANLAKTKTGKPPKLYDSLIGEALLLLDLAIRQALAGDMDPSRWSGRPVVDLVDEIYREHLNNANRREHRRRNGDSSVSLVPFEDSEYFDGDTDGVVIPDA